MRKYTNGSQKSSTPKGLAEGDFVIVIVCVRVRLCVRVCVWLCVVRLCFFRIGLTAPSHVVVFTAPRRRSEGKISEIVSVLFFSVHLFVFVVFVAEINKNRICYWF